MFLRMISRCTRSADFTAASRRNCCAGEVMGRPLDIETKYSIAKIPRIATVAGIDWKLAMATENFDNQSNSGNLLFSSTGLFPRQYACQMNGPGLVSAFFHDSLHVHQAAGIDGGYILGSGHGDVVCLGHAHGHGNALKFGGKGPAEAAAL